VTSAPPVRVPHHTTAEGHGVALGRGPVTVHVYVDFQCPYCRAFELSSGEGLRTMATDGLITLVVHPMDFLAGASPDGYSSRAASAAGCAADSGRFMEYARVLFEHQPPEGGPGLTDEQLVELGAEVGLGDDRGFARCVLDHRYVTWADRGTRRALERGVSATPTVLVRGVPVPATSGAIAVAVRAAGR
jgi:protein-disulfide isomerase